MNGSCLRKQGVTLNICAGSRPTICTQSREVLAEPFEVGVDLFPFVEATESFGPAAEAELVTGTVFDFFMRRWT